MPWNRKLYPDNWEAIALEVKERAKWKCEECGKECRKKGESSLDFMSRIDTDWYSECPVVKEFTEHPTRWVLTVAHMDHCPENCDPENLKALCAPCHCRYDLSQMARKKMLKAERLGQLGLNLT